MFESFFVVINLRKTTSDSITWRVLLGLIIVMSTVLRILWSTFNSSFLLMHLRTSYSWYLWCIIELKCLESCLSKYSLRWGSVILDYDMISLESWKRWIRVLIYSNWNMMTIQWDTSSDRVSRSTSYKESLWLLEMISKATCFIVVIFVIEQVDIIIWRFHRVL